MIHHPDYEKFWTMAEELDISVGFHEGGNSGMPQVGMDRFEERGARHIITHTMEMMLACMSVIWGGVCERHPKLRIAFLESGGGWIAPLARPHGPPFRRPGLQRFRPDDAAERAVPAQLLDLVRAGREHACSALADYIGPHKILWATDYPHPDGFFPGAPAMVRKLHRGRVAGDGQPGDGRRREGVLRAALSVDRPRSYPLPCGRG